jgi:hypothetical protein
MLEQQNPDSIPEGPMILLHGFSNQQALAIMRAVKAALPGPADIAFSTTTPTNLDWKLADLIREVREEHEYMKQNPPSAT